MLQRIKSALAACGIVAAGLLAAPPAEAHPGHGGGTSRSCLSGAARSLLSSIEARFGAMQIVSTCRPGARMPSGRVSLHASGNAIDFNAGSRKAEVVAWLRANHSGGLMTYAGMSHIHVDTGQRFVSLSGQRLAVGYGRGDRGYRRSAASYRPTSARYARSSRRAARHASAPRSERTYTVTTTRRGSVRYARYE